MVMCSNHYSMQFGYLCGKYPGRLGWLISPGGWRTEPPKYVSYALDNGAFVAWKNRTEWDESAFWALLERAMACRQEPLWVVVPDVVGDPAATMQKWDAWSVILRKAGITWPLAFAAQDGMKLAHAPKNADVIFVGGGTEWRWNTLRTWTKHFKRVHVGMANSERLLWQAHESGAESSDGTGWFKNPQMVEELERYLSLSSGQGQREPRQIIMETVMDDL